MVVSSVSPARAAMTARLPWRRAWARAASVSVKVPTWPGLITTALAARCSWPRPIRSNASGEQVVTGKLDRPPEPGGQRRPAGPVVVTQAVLDRDDRVLPGPVFEHGDHRRRVVRIAADGHLVGVRADIEDVRRGDVDRHGNVAADLHSGVEHGFQQKVDGVGARPELRAVGAVVANQVRRVTMLVEDRPQSVVDGDDHRQRLGKVASPDRDHHDVLEVERPANPRGPRDHVRHRQRQTRLGGFVVRQVPFPEPAEMDVERLAAMVGRCSRHGNGHRQQGVGPEPRPVRRRVEGNQGRINMLLVVEVHPQQQGGHLRRDQGDRLADAPAAMPVRLEVAEFPRLVLTDAPARGGPGQAPGPGLGSNLDLQGRLPPRVEYLASDELFQDRQDQASFRRNEDLSSRNPTHPSTRPLADPLRPILPALDRCQSRMN